MASPPRSSGATSPPYPSHIPLPSNPRKRPSIHLQSNFNPSKKRKQGSIASAASSAHPLRQTSFPPSEGADSALRSPSVDSDYTAVTGDGARSAVTAGSNKIGKKRRRKGKKDRETSGSVAGKSRTEKSVTGDPEDDDDDDDDGGDDLLDQGEDTENKEMERKRLSVLIEHFDADQAERYETFRRIKLRKETVRKIANFTLAQSVPPAVITTINGYTKTFIGNLIERAREVQQQWAALETPPQTPEGDRKVKTEATDVGAGNLLDDIFASDGTTTNTDAVVALGDNAAKKPQRDLGPLLPDHIREALRRYRRDGDTEATGLTGFSVGLGMPGAGSARLQGRRLFR